MKLEVCLAHPGGAFQVICDLGLKFEEMVTLKEVRGRDK